MVLERTRSNRRPAGYTALLERYGIQGVRNWHRSFIVDGVTRHVTTGPAGVDEAYPVTYWPDETPGDHLEFALKYDGTNLVLLATLFAAIPVDAIVEYIQSTPTGKYARRIWFLYEMMTGDRLPLANVSSGNYVDLLEADEYFVIDAEAATKVRRQRINNNLLGTKGYCPMVRKTETLNRFIAKDLSARSKEIVSAYLPELLKRALSYLYRKETKSSFEIERIAPSSSKTERFVSLLRSAVTDNLCTKSHLVDLQNQIVDPRFRDTEYRSNQNYIGQSVNWGNERVHYVCPRPEDVRDLMFGLIALNERVDCESIHPVLHATMISYGFVFIYPFEDGNGRIHRLLIHNILARRCFVPPGAIFPVSAVMLKRPAEYDASLEAFSRLVMEMVEYSLDDQGKMIVTNDVGAWYRYPDMTPQTEALFGFIEQTIEVELVNELAFLECYDTTKTAMQEVVDLPDRDLDLFIRCCLQNNGKLSNRKQSARFSKLSDDEIQRLEAAVATGYPEKPSSR